MAALTLVSTKDMTRETWFNLRKKGIGGSDAAAIAGISKWKSPIAVYLEKIGELKQDDEQSEAAYWGNMLEDVVAKEFSLQTGLKIQRRNAILQHPKYPWMLANVDRLIVGQKAGLECKTTNEYNKNAWDEDKVPEDYIIQCHHYMAVTGYSQWWIAVLIGGNKFKYKLIEREDVIINHLIQIESDFWKMIQDKTPPAMDGSDSSSNVLDILYPEAKLDTEIILPPEADELLKQYIESSAEEKAAAYHKEEAKNKLKALMGDVEKAFVGNNKVYWKNVTSNRCDTKTLKKDHPDLFLKYCKESISRRFEIK